MKLFASLDAKDRKLLIGCMCAVIVVAAVTAIFARNEDQRRQSCAQHLSHGQAWRARCLRIAPGQRLRSRAVGAAAQRLVGPDRRTNRSDLRRAQPHLTRRSQSRAGHSCPGRARAVDGMVGRDSGARRKRLASGAIRDRLQAHAAGTRPAGRIGRSVDGSRGCMGSEPAARPHRVQLRGLAGRGGVHERQGRGHLVGQLHAA